MIFWWYFDDILLIFWWYVDDILMIFWWYFDDILMTNLRLSSSLSRSCLVSCFSTWPWALWWWLLQLWIILWWWWLWISWWWLLRLWWWWLWVSSWILQLWWWPPCSFQLLRRQVRAVAPAQHHEDIFTITMTKISTMMVTQWLWMKYGQKPLTMAMNRFNSMFVSSARSSLIMVCNYWFAKATNFLKCITVSML